MYGDRWYSSKCGMDKEEMIRFAELIVRGCVDIVGNLPSGYKDYRDQIEDSFRQACIEQIKEHFGVKNE